VVSGSWSTDSAQRISILYLAKSATNHLGRLSSIPRAQRNSPTVSLSLFLFLSFSGLCSLHLFLRYCANDLGAGALLFLYFSLPFFPSLSFVCISFLLAIERGGRSKDAGTIDAANDMRPAAAGQTGNSRTRDLDSPETNRCKRFLPSVSSQ